MKNRLPAWFRQEIPDRALVGERNALFSNLQLNTVCSSARCPNIYDCFKRHTATFMILGKVCTRDCRFCAVEKGRPQLINAAEPENITTAVKDLGLQYVVITSVTRDDLEDGGARQFSLTVNHLQAALPGIKTEVLIPDFQGKKESLETVVKSRPDVIAHNVETVARLYPTVRPQADYARSLELLRRIKELDASIITKSGIMVGLGEKEEEIVAVMKDLRKVDCDILTIGQYLAPTPKHLPVKIFLTPAQFQKLERVACSLGFKQVSCGPLVRSSYHSQEIFHRCTI